MKVSILVLTIDRFELTSEWVGKALKSAGYPFELCISDNGSTDCRIFDWCEQQRPKLYIKNGYNRGTTQALNMMVAMNPSDAYVFIGNDIEMPQGWLREFVRCAEAVENAGMIGMDWRQKAKDWPTKVINGVEIIPPPTEGDRIFGATFITQKALDVVGSFCEDYGTYGMWDSDLNVRCRIGGLQNFYVKGYESKHQGGDCGEKSEYRAMKDASLRAAGPVFLRNAEGRCLLRINIKVSCWLLVAGYWFLYSSSPVKAK